MSPEPLLEIEDLKVHFDTDEGVVKAVDGLSLEVREGEMLGIVGESGSGKSVANMTILGLTRASNAAISGRITFEGQDLLTMDDDGLQRDPRQRDRDDLPGPAVGPASRSTRSATSSSRRSRSTRTSAMQPPARTPSSCCELVGIPDAERRMGEYPHEFSGGMRQRVMIAMALTNDPKLLIADEPTTALDVTTQAQILRLIERLRDELGMAVIMITHDLGVIAEVADRVMVMYAGEVVESGTLDQIFYDPQHPYTWGLLGSLTRVDQPRLARLAQIAGQPPSLINPPSGCHFRNRCPHEFAKCTEHPELEQRAEGAGHATAAGCRPTKKKTLRVVETGEIGLEAPKEPAA